MGDTLEKNYQCSVFKRKIMSEREYDFLFCGKINVRKRQKNMGLLVTTNYPSPTVIILEGIKGLAVQ